MWLQLQRDIFLKIKAERSWKAEERNSTRLIEQNIAPDIWKFRRRKAHLSVRLENSSGMAWSVCGSGTWPHVRWKLHPSSANFGAKRYRVEQVTAVEEGWVDFDF